MAYQEIYHRRLWKLSVGQGILCVAFCIGGIALIALAMSLHSGRISDRLLMIAIGVLLNCIGPLLWWSGMQTNREVSGLDVKFKEGTITSGEWRRVSESQNSPRWFEAQMDDPDAGRQQILNFYDRWQEGNFESFEQKLQQGQVAVKLWYVGREEEAQPILMRVEVQLD
jgi:hypothetical protein